MTAAISRPPFLLDAPRGELALLCRRICANLDREPQTISSLEAAFQDALSSIQAQYPSAGLGEDDLWEIVRDEERRVADALLVAEMLLPQIQSLLKQQRPAPAANTPAAAPAVPAPIAGTNTEPAPEKRSEPRPPSRPASPLGIADLIDGMLDQQRNERRPSRS